MALVVETGAGISGAESYATVAAIDAFWGNRQHTEFYTAWDAASAEAKEGAAREASGYLDALLSTSYRGRRKGWLQGLEWPRSEARDDDGFDLPALPPQLIRATCELAARAVTGPLSQDAEVSGGIKRTRLKVDVYEEETEYAGTARQEAKHGSVLESLAPILTGTQPGARQTWAWR
ncbi:hypothetical protein A8B82_15275 [Sulfitobacter sp. EhC04]|uniref:DnaT-like ssDNA-binding protein n=1 Tax=Sulfitobacter sp. EhC04 TaxID=1849168 RepID=UPI0007F3817A|nr:DnaT-like ssDNA-binding protein [Sulfitobacter sp. EhC04]OAN76751.1 hypothetical protein A8B82_15275 [Sulfitobacter sp. EhC04]